MKSVRLFVFALMMALPVLAVASASHPSDAPAANAPKWNLDRAHSNLTFSIRHFFTPVVGKFKAYNVDLNFDPNNLAGSSINVEVDVNSVDTENDSRDGHLKTADFFDSAAYPKMTFKSSSITKTGQNSFVAKGKLTIRNITKDIEMPFTLLGVQDNPRNPNAQIAGFESSFKLNRLDYGVGSGDYISTAVIGNELTVNIFLEVNRTK
jgi:polyisoprenoid-binding protein YceI